MVSDSEKTRQETDVYETLDDLYDDLAETLALEADARFPYDDEECQCEECQQFYS